MASSVQYCPPLHPRARGLSLVAAVLHFLVVMVLLPDVARAKTTRSIPTAAATTAAILLVARAWF